MRRVTIAVLCLLLLGWLASLGAVAYAARHDAAAQASAIVVLGAAQYNGRPSPVLKARLDQAADLYRRHLAPQVIVTGGVGNGDTLSEAAVGRNYLLETAGLPNEAVETEDAGQSSLASLRAVAHRITTPPRTVILVSDGFHMFRLGIIARRLGLEAFGSPTPSSPIRASRRREIGYILAESIKAPVAFIVTRSE
jgi:uncharacterized SAM-binding protein YcdF (DUF218 family)